MENQKTIGDSRKELGVLSKVQGDELGSGSGEGTAMKRWPPHRCAALFALGCALLPLPAARGVVLWQEDNSPTAVLLGRARTLEQRGRLDLAKQDWAQVLLLQPDDAEALAGLVRAARAEGRSSDAAQYLARLRSSHPKDPELARLETVGKGKDSAADLTEADRLMRTGDARAALAIYRRLYGTTPPPGAPALAFYQAEAATDDGRPQAIAGLRALADRYPADARYSVALGRVLLASPRTRAEGRTILEGYPGNPEAVAALHTGARPGETTGSAQEAAPRHNEVVAVQALAHPIAKPSPAVPMPPAANAAMANHRTDVLPNVAFVESVPRVTVVKTSTTTRHQAFAAQEQAGFAALNQHRAAEAEQVFQGILTRDPSDPRALAGMGYLRQTTGDLKSAVVFFERAQENGDHSLALTRALVNAQFDLAVQQSGMARTRGDLPGAEVQYRAALRERPNDPEALEGLATVLLQSGRAEDAAPVFDHLTRVRPLDPGAWRGLVIAQASSGRGAAAVQTEQRIPADAKAPLLHDPSYLQALETARGMQPTGTQVAEAEPPVRSPQVPTKVQPAAPTTALKATPPPTQIAAVPLQKSVPAPVTAAPPVSAPASNLEVSPGTAVPASKSAPSSIVASSRAPSKKVGGAMKPGRVAADASRSSMAVVAPAPVQPVPVAVANSRGETLATERTQQGREALTRGESARAADLFRDAIADAPERPEAWKGLVEALHIMGRNNDAAAAMSRVPDATRSVLDRDATFQALLGSALLGADRPDEALRAFARAQEIFATQRLPPPLDLVLRVATLLAARNDDGNLYRELIYLGNRPDMNDPQRRDVQMIWTSWAVRRARALAAAGEPRRAVAILNAAAEAFAGNQVVLSAVADGYVGVGLPREAVALYKAKDLSGAPEPELEAAVRAAIASHDFKAAQGWIRQGRERFPNSPGMLTENAELEQSRGHQERAVELARQAKALAPAQDPGQVLTAELHEAQAGSGWKVEPAGKLSVLLAPEQMGVPSTSARPFLPGSSEASASQVQRTPVLTGFDEPSR